MNDERLAPVDGDLAEECSVGCRRPYAAPRLRSGQAFERVLAHSCTDDNEDDCADFPGCLGH